MTRKEQVALWDAINRYVEACGGDPGKNVYGNTVRMLSAVEVEEVVRKIERAAVNGAIDEALNSGNGNYKP